MFSHSGTGMRPNIKTTEAQAVEPVEPSTGIDRVADFLCNRALPMESSSSSSFSSFEYSLSQWDYLNLFILRPILAVVFTLSLISVGWFLAWKLVLVHVPLVQEIFSLRKKPDRLKPPSRRLSKFYNSLNSQNSASGW